MLSIVALIFWLLYFLRNIWLCVRNSFIYLCFLLSSGGNRSILQLWDEHLGLCSALRHCSWCLYFNCSNGVEKIRFTGALSALVNGKGQEWYLSIVLWLSILFNSKHVPWRGFGPYQLAHSQRTPLGVGGELFSADFMETVTMLWQAPELKLEA